VAVYPKYAGAWYELGEVYYLRLAALAAQEQKWQEVSEWSSKLIKLNSLDFPAAYYFHMVANFNLHNLAVAEQSARQRTVERLPEARARWYG
jgi:hypothetical protein